MGASGRRGFSLLEVLVVVAILAAIGLVAVVSLRPTQAVALEAAAETVAEAIRFARSEAMRRREPRGFLVRSATAEIEIFVPNTASTSTSPGATVEDPLTRRGYRRSLRKLPGCERIEIRSAPKPFTYSGVSGQREMVVFDGRGDPFLVVSGDRKALAAGTLVLALDGETRSIALSPIGRVTR